LGKLGKGAGSPINPSLTPLPQTRLKASLPQQVSPRRSSRILNGTAADAGCASPPRETSGDEIRGPAACRCNTVCTCARAHQSRYTAATAQWRSRDDRGESTFRHSTGKGRARRAPRRPSQRHGAGSEARAGWRDVVPNKARPPDEAPSATRGEGGGGRPWSPFTTICTSSHWETG